MRITKVFHFEMAHALHGYGGPCENIHGHSYELGVSVIGKVDADTASPSCGMVLDFTYLKRLVAEKIISKYDHAFVVWERSPLASNSGTEKAFERALVTGFQPTCENLLLEFASVLTNALPDGCSLYRLQLRETPTSYAEWFAEDNA